MYKELISEVSKGNEFVKIQPPCPESEIDRVEKVLGYPLPKELRGLLRELNGDKWLFFSAEEIIDQIRLNKEMLSFYEEEGIEGVDRLIFFAGNGCGDYYCYLVGEDGVPDENAIYMWEHEEMRYDRKVAVNMLELITRYYNDEI